LGKWYGILPSILLDPPNPLSSLLSPLSSLLSSLLSPLSSPLTPSVLLPYKKIRQANVIGTLELLKMAIPRKIPFNFISTLSVLRPERWKPVEEIHLNDRNYSENPNGYP
jgi:hypothetical protein